MNPICLFDRSIGATRVVVEFRVSPCDLWMGVHLEPRPDATIFYLCFLPMLALRVIVVR